MFFQNINYLTIIVATALCVALGFLWYSSIMFGRRWMKEMGLTQETISELKKKNGVTGMVKTHAISVLFTLVSAYVIAALINSLVIVNFWSLVILAIFLWLAFSMPVALNYTLFGGKQSYAMFAINTGYQLISLIVMILIIGIFS